MTDSALSLPAHVSLTHLADRLFVLAQALQHGEEVPDHYERVGAEAEQIFMELDDILAFEEMRREQRAEEIKKFEQGFAYVAKK